MTISKIRVLIICLTVPLLMSAQSNKFNSSRGGFNGGSNAFNSSRENTFNDHRTKLCVEYVKLARGAWNTFDMSRGIVPPDHDVKPVAPVRISDEDLHKEQKDNKIEFESVVKPTINKNGAKPIAPIKEIEESAPESAYFTFFGTKVGLRKPMTVWPRLASTDRNDVVDMIERLSAREFNNMLYDCVDLKKSMSLDDWPFMLAVKAFSESVYGANSNESAVLTGYILGQAGYKVRLARSDEKVGVLFASKHRIYNKPYFKVDNDNFYFIGQSFPDVQICPAFFASEIPMSLWINSSPMLSQNMSEYRNIKSERYPDFNYSVSVDKNLVKMFDTYPSSEIGGDFMTKWAMYASTPMSDNTKKELYSKMSSLISGLSKEKAAEKILNWVQTGFVYEYDDKVWGGDRAFFPEETLYYPYCDCEDRILYTRIVRDLLRLDCLLVYYPGHLATAVCFDNHVPGDYIEYNGKRYLVCDPTYIGAGIGQTMPNMDNSMAKVVVLPR